MKEEAYKVASGEIENPVLTLEVNGEVEIIKGRDARYFCFGYLFALKSEREGLSLDNRVENE